MDILINSKNIDSMQALHNQLSLVMFVICIFFTWYGFYLKDKQKIYITTIGLILFGFIQEIVDFVNRIFLDEEYQMAWDLDLPLHLCNLALITAVILLYDYAKNMNLPYRKYIFDFTYVMAFSGALNAILTVEWDFINNYLGVITGQLQHSLIILYILWLISAYGARFSYQGIWRTLIVLNILIIPVGFINYLLDSNYIYLCEAPNVENPLLITKQWPWYIISLEFLAVIYMHILYIPFWVGNRLNSKEIESIKPNS